VKFDFIYSLGVFEKLREATLVFIMSVRWEQLNFYYSDFHDIRYLRMSGTYVEKFQVSLNSERIAGPLHEVPSNV
jgi:hypothetical protein